MKNDIISLLTKYIGENKMLDKKEKDTICINCREESAVTPPMLINEISRLFFWIVKHKNGELNQKATKEQHSARLILIYLSKHDGATQSELVKFTRMRAPTISITLRNMENEDLVFRVSDEVDQRVTHVYITEKGRRVDADNLARLKAVDSIMMEGVSSDEATSMMKTLLIMRENLVKEINTINEAD